MKEEYQQTYSKGGIAMDIRQRLLSIKILENMEEMHKNGNKKVVKDDKGYSYINEYGEIIRANVKKEAGSN